MSMPTPKDNLKDRFARYRQIKLSVIGGRSGEAADAVLSRQHSGPTWLTTTRNAPRP